VIEALARVLLETVGRVLVLGLGLALLRALRRQSGRRGAVCRKPPSETACFITGMAAWAAILALGLHLWRALHAA
jgi:hypothetical protein